MNQQAEYKEILQEIGTVAFALASCGEKGDYGFLMQQFENTARTLVAVVDALVNEICDDCELGREAAWQHRAIYVADELARYPRRLLAMGSPDGYETLHLLYFEWSDACEGLGLALRVLPGKDEEDSPLYERICRVEKALAVVRAHDRARAIYLRELHRRLL